VLSPGVPYTEEWHPATSITAGHQGDVFFTDGENEVVDQSTQRFELQRLCYVATVAPARPRTVFQRRHRANTALDTKIATLCTSVKTNGTARMTSDVFSVRGHLRSISARLPPR
jgi:hypothetical protein